MTSRRLSIVWPVLLIAVAAVWMLQAVGTLPAAAADLISRGWPIVLVLLGLMLLLGRRVRFGNFLSIVVCAVLVGGVVMAAYRQQTSKVRTENHKQFSQPVGSAITNVKIVVNLLIDDVEVVADSTSAINADFLGSRESTVTADFQVDGKTGTFTLAENQSSAIPPLEAMGKGKVVVHVPGGLAFDQISISGREGDMSLDASTIAVKNLSMSTSAGNITVKLPDKSGLIGDIKTGSGNALIEVPKTIAANISLRGAGANNPAYNGSDYVLDVNRTLISKRAAEPQMQITLEASGTITVQ